MKDPLAKALRTPISDEERARLRQDLIKSDEPHDGA